MLQRGVNEPGKPVTVFADDIDAGRNARGLRGRQQAGRARAVLGVGLIQSVQEQDVSEMEDARPEPVKIKVGATPKRVGAARVEEGAPPVALLRHYIGVGGGRFWRRHCRPRRQSLRIDCGYWRAARAGDTHR